MLNQIKNLTSDTAIYGISTIAGRFLNFLLVPFYTNVLVPGEYGLVAYVYSFLAFLNVVYAFGMESAYFKFSTSSEVKSPKEVFSTSFIAVAIPSLLFSSFIIINSSIISYFLAIPSNHDKIVLFSSVILFLDAIAVVPFAVLRRERRAKTFATIKFLNIVINVSMNIILLVHYKMGIEGIFISGVIASASTILLLTPTIVRNFTISFSGTLYTALLKFGLPTIPAGLAGMVIQVVDRPILRSLTNDAMVGIYQANYRLGIFMMLVVSMFDYAWRPFYFSISKEPDAKNIFARVLTYFTFISAYVFIIISVFISDIVKLQIFGRFLIHPSYWDGLSIVPIILLGYVFLGISTNLTAGIYIEKKTYFLPIVTIISALFNVVANYILIPMYNFSGAAWATLIAYFVMALMYYFISHHIYPIQYELVRLGKIGVTTAIVFLIYNLSDYWNISDTLVYLLVKIILVLSFVIILFIIGFFEKGEISGLLSLIRKKESNDMTAIEKQDNIEQKV